MSDNIININPDYSGYKEDADNLREAYGITSERQTFIRKELVKIAVDSLDSRYDIQLNNLINLLDIQEIKYLSHVFIGMSFERGMKQIIGLFDHQPYN